MTQVDSNSLSLIDVLNGLPASIKAVAAMGLWQRLTLAFYTLGSFAGVYAATGSWPTALATAAGFFVAHAHGHQIGVQATQAAVKEQQQKQVAAIAVLQGGKDVPRG